MCLTKQKPIEIRSGRGTGDRPPLRVGLCYGLNRVPPDDRPLSSSPVLRTSPRLEMGSS